MENEHVTIFFTVGGRKVTRVTLSKHEFHIVSNRSIDEAVAMIMKKAPQLDVSIAAIIINQMTAGNFNIKEVKGGTPNDCSD